MDKNVQHINKQSAGMNQARKMTSGLNVAFSLLLGIGAALMLNYLSALHHQRWKIGINDYYQLSPKTVSILEGLSHDTQITVFFEQEHELIDHLKNILKEYEYVMNNSLSGSLTVEFVDPDRDLSRTRELAHKYGLKRPNTIVFECAGRKKFVEDSDISEYGLQMNDEGMSKKLLSYKAEQAISSAIHNVSQETAPVVYFVAGHGERDVNDYSRHSGYSSVEKIMRRDNIEVRTLFLSGSDRIPVDCSALVIAGPDRKYSDPELKIISDYLAKSGRLLCLIDPAVVTGLESFFREWGVQLSSEVAVGMTLTGRELVVSAYGEHPVTRNFNNLTTMFYMPRCIDPASSEPPVRTEVTILATNTEEGWGETSLEQAPPRYDPGIDRPGPVPIAVAVEKGPGSGIDVELPPSKLVIIGDSAFVCNGALRTGVGGNNDFFMSAVNWLLERDELMDISARQPLALTLDMNRRQWINIRLLLIGGVPGLVILIGIAVWFSRRK